MTDATAARYLHGYSPEEQRRLVEQAEYWRETLILPDLPYRPGERLLDVGCGAGAVLGVIAAAHPGLRLAGIDREAAQIAAAGRHLESLGVIAPAPPLAVCGSAATGSGRGGHRGQARSGRSAGGGYN